MSMSRMRSSLPLLAVLAALALGALLHTDDRAGVRPLRSAGAESAAPAQATSTEAPPIASCPTPDPPLPPGLWPIPGYDEVFVERSTDNAGKVQLDLVVCLRNDGPGTWGPMAIRVEGCVPRRLQVRAMAIEEFFQRCYRIPLSELLDEPCTIMHDAECESATPFDPQRIWTGRVETRDAEATATPPIAGQEPLRFAITPVADTWYQVDVGTGIPVNPTPQGGEWSLHGGWWDTGIDEHTILRFDVPTPRPELQFKRAELELDIVRAEIIAFDPQQPTSGTMSIAFRHVESEWEEATLSSVNPPALSNFGVERIVEWGPCNEEGCGRPRVDITEMIRDSLVLPQDAKLGFDYRASGIFEGPLMGTSFVVGSRESQRSPLLHLEYEDPFRATTTPIATSVPTVTVSTTPVTQDGRVFLPFCMGR